MDDQLRNGLQWPYILEKCVHLAQLTQTEKWTSTEIWVLTQKWTSMPTEKWTSTEKWTQTREMNKLDEP